MIAMTKLSEEQRFSKHGQKPNREKKAENKSKRTLGKFGVWDAVDDRTGTTPKPNSAPMWKYKDWLGTWEDDYNNITNITEFVLQAKYSIQGSLNEPLVKQLLDLSKFEAAVQSEHGTDEFSNEDVINHRALQYARAASVSRACAFKIDATNIEKHELPFFGPATLKVVKELISTGTCEELEAFREGSVVSSSKGEPRADTLGADVRRLFKGLPGVGVGIAKAWWDAGFRSFEDVEEADRVVSDNDQEVSAPHSKKTWMSKNLRFALKHRTQLMEECPVADLDEMQEELLDSLQAVTGTVWQLWVVGGGRRASAFHDGDFVASHAKNHLGGVTMRLVDHLIAKGRLVSREEGMCTIQQNRRPSTVKDLRYSPSGPKASNHNLLADRHDHLIGIFITREGKHRRMDVILPPWAELAFCLISWTGSKQYMRFMRQYAVNKGMHMNAHRMMRKDGNAWYVIPEEMGPSDRDQKEVWPAGWSKERKIETERDVFELLQLPWREAHERNC